MTDRKLSTRLAHLRGTRLDPPSVNPPVEHASTILFTDPEQLYDAKPGYGRMGLTVHRELETALCELEGAETAVLTPNGLSACALAIAAMVRSGDHVLAVDSLYGPTRRFCERRLDRMGVGVTRFHPHTSVDALTDMIRPETRVIVLETPGSLTFECIDTRAIVDFANERGLVTILDNTWGAGIYHRPLELGVDISVQALTKYVVGHADAFGGAVMTRRSDLSAQLEACRDDWGLALGPNEAYTALRGLRTLGLRLKHHEASALALADWLAGHPSVARVLHPAREDHPDHDIWARDFTGSCGLFGIVLHPQPSGAVNDMLRRMQLFGMGFSWGGFESLMIPCDRQLNRAAPDWKPLEGPLLRIHAGLEDPSDLIADLEQAFTVLSGPT